MQIEVTIDGKGSVTIAQEIELSPKDVKKLTVHCAELLRAQGPKGPGFGGKDD